MTAKHEDVAASECRTGWKGWKWRPVNYPAGHVFTSPFVIIAANGMPRSRARFFGAHMKKLLLILLTGLTMAGIANACYAQHRGSGFHGGNAFHGNGFHNGGFHHFHHGRFNHGFFFISAPFFWGPGVYPYLYPYPYPVTTYDYLDPAMSYAPAQQDYRYYCPDQGYYPSIQTCPKGWLRVIPEN